MPILKQITCKIEYGPKNIVLAEYATQYGDGFVNTYICVPEHSENFCIHLSSSGYIAPGVAMFVFIDGVPQCNRNRRDLVIPDATTRPEQTEVDFRVKQKEDKIGRGCWLGRQWTFAHLNTVASKKSTNCDDGSTRNIGTIEVVVLRCQDMAVPKASTEVNDAQRMKESNVVENEPSKTKSLAGQSDSVVELLGGLFDGPSDGLYDSHDIGKGLHSPFVYKPRGYDGTSIYRGQRRDSPPYHRMAYRDTNPEHRSATDRYNPLGQWNNGQKTYQQGETWDYNRGRYDNSPRLDEYQTKDQDNPYRAQFAQRDAEDLAYKRLAHPQRRVQVMSPPPPSPLLIPRWLRQPASNISSNWARDLTERADIRPPQQYNNKSTSDLLTHPAGSLARGIRFGPTRRYRRDYDPDPQYTRLGEGSTWNPGPYLTHWPLRQAQRRKPRDTPPWADFETSKKDDHADIDTKSNRPTAAGSGKYGDYKLKSNGDRIGSNRWGSHKHIWEDEDPRASIRGNRNGERSDAEKWKKDEWNKSNENETTGGWVDLTHENRKKNNKDGTAWNNDTGSSSSSNGDNNDAPAWTKTTSNGTWKNLNNSGNAWVTAHRNDSWENKIDTNKDDAWGNANNNDNAWVNANNNDNAWGNANNNDNTWENANNNYNAWNNPTNDNTCDELNNHDAWNTNTNNDGWGNAKATSPASSVGRQQKGESKSTKKKHRKKNQKSMGTSSHKWADISTAAGAPADDGKTSHFDPTKPLIKSYWNHAAHYEGSCKDGQEVRGKSKVYVTPEEPLRAIPESIAEAKKLSHQVQPGKGAVYKHSIARPKYIDSMRHPYAVFTFKYRSKDVLEKLLNVEVKESKEPMRSRLDAMSKDEVIEQFLRAKKYAGYDENSSLDAFTPASSSSSSSSDSQVSSSSDSQSSVKHKGAWDTKSRKKDSKKKMKRKKSKKRVKEEKRENGDNHISNSHNSNNKNNAAAELW